VTPLMEPSRYVASSTAFLSAFKIKIKKKAQAQFKDRKKMSVPFYILCLILERI